MKKRSPEPAAADRWLKRRLEYASKHAAETPIPDSLVAKGLAKDTERAYLDYKHLVMFADKTCEVCSGKGIMSVARADQEFHNEVCGCALRRVTEIPGVDIGQNADGSKSFYLDLRVPELKGVADALDLKAMIEEAKEVMVDGLDKNTGQVIEQTNASAQSDGPAPERDPALE